MWTKLEGLGSQRCITQRKGVIYNDTNSSTGSGKRGGKQDRNENQSAGKVKRYEG